MEDFNLPPRVRKAVYVVSVLGSAIVVPLEAMALLPAWVSPVWISLTGAASLLARFNVNNKGVK